MGADQDRGDLYSLSTPMGMFTTAFPLAAKAGDNPGVHPQGRRAVKKQGAVWHDQGGKCAGLSSQVPWVHPDDGPFGVQHRVAATPLARV